MHLPHDRLGIVQAGSACNEAKRDHSEKQGLLGAMMGSIGVESKRIQAGKTFGFGGSCLIAARK